MITREQCENLKSRFEDYCGRAEQHEFVKLFKIDSLMRGTWNYIDEMIETNQKDLKAMFRVVLTTINAPQEEIAQYAKGEDE